MEAVVYKGTLEEAIEFMTKKYPEVTVNDTDSDHSIYFYNGPQVEDEEAFNLVGVYDKEFSTLDIDFSPAEEDEAVAEEAEEAEEDKG